MTEREEELRLERELRETLRDRDPGPAPYGLRGRIDRIPDEVPLGRRLALLSRSMPVLAAAAAAVVMVLVGSRLWPAGPMVGPGASPAASPVQAVTFDPTLVGPGVAIAPAGDPGWLVALGVLALVLVAISIRGRWRAIPGVLIAGLVAWAVFASQVPITLDTPGSGIGLNTVRAEGPPVFDEEVIYELAPPGEPFSVAFMVTAESVVPVRIDGFIYPYRDERLMGYPMWRAAWLDQERDGNGGATGLGIPFEPFVANGRYQMIHLVGRAGQCAAGAAFDPADQTYGYSSIDRVTVQVTTLGWPRTVVLALPFKLAEPMSDPCP